MEQFQGVPGASQASFDTLNTQISALKTTDKWKEKTLNNATIGAAAGWLPIDGLTIDETPVCIGYCSSSSYRFGSFAFYGAWYLSVFTNTGSIPASNTNIGNVRIRYYEA